MVLFTLLKALEPSPELAHSEMDYEGLKGSPFSQRGGISNNKRNLPNTQVNVVQYCYLYKYFQDAHNISIQFDVYRKHI